MIREIRARVLLSSAKEPDPLFGIKYTMNLYRGCQHQCIYCDSRSECYRIENFADILVKVNAIELLKKELPRKRTKGIVGTGSMNDPYMPLEAERRLTRSALEIIAENHFAVHVITKGDLVVRDLDLLSEIGREFATVSFTITTADDTLGKKLEPGAAPVSRRYQAMEKLAANGIRTGVTMMPILPFIEDREENIRAIVHRAAESGACYVLPGWGMTLRDRQRAYYFEKLDALFPGLHAKYEKRYGPRYSCLAPNARFLQTLFEELTREYGLATQVPPYQPGGPSQLALF